MSCSGIGLGRRVMRSVRLLGALRNFCGLNAQASRIAKVPDCPVAGRRVRPDLGGGGSREAWRWLRFFARGPGGVRGAKGDAI